MDRNLKTHAGWKAGSSLVVALVAAGGALGAESRKSAEPLVPVPAVKAPRFPLEPGKKPSKPAEPGTYVEGPGSPPSKIDAAIRPPNARSDEKWQKNLQLGWLFTSQVSHHEFTGTSIGLTPVRRDSNTPLSLGARFRLRPPFSPVSFRLEGAMGFGDAEAVASRGAGGLAKVQFSTQDFQASAGPRLHFFGASRTWDLRLAVDGLFRNSTYVTLDSAGTAIDSDNRTVVGVVPALELGYEPNVNWGAQIAFRYGSGITASGSSGVTGSGYRRLVAELEAYRYVGTETAIGFGFAYLDEDVTWSQAQASALNDEVSSSGTELRLFLKQDL